MNVPYLNALPNALVVVSSSGDIEFINPAAEGLLSLSQSQALGRNVSQLPVFDEKLLAMIGRVFASGEEVSLFEHALLLPMQAPVLVTLHLTLLQVEDAPKVMLTIEKTAGLKRLAASAWKQESTRAAGVMAAMLAHEVKNPLSGIRGAAQLLRDEVTPEHQSLADLICRESDRISDLLGQVEIFSGDESLEKSAVNIHEVLQYVISVAKAGFAAHVKFIEKYDPSLPSVLSHRDTLVQLFLNLVKNAAEAMAGQEDATLTLHTQYRSGYRMQRELPVAVVVEDNGPGIPDAIRPHIFEPLISSKEMGRGLGLAVVAKLASDLGIMVELDEEKRGGARFNVLLPVAS